MYPHSFTLSSGPETDILVDLAAKVIDWQESWVAFNFLPRSRVRVQNQNATRQCTNRSQHGHSIFSPPRPRHPTHLLRPTIQRQPQIRFVSQIPLNGSHPCNHANVTTASLTITLYWGTVEACIGIIVACLPTLQFMFRQNKWKAVVGLAVTTPTASSAERKGSQPFKMRLGSNPAIQVDRTVDVTFANADSDTMLAQTKNWVHNDKSEGGSEDIEMQDNIFGSHFQVGHSS